MTQGPLLYVRLALHTCLNGLPYLSYQWTTLILPELLAKNFGITEKTQVSFYASLLYVSYFCGLFVSCFIWPFMVKFVSKRRLILFSTTMFGVITMCSGIGNSLIVVLIARFLCGMCLNVNSIGKDLLFEFCKGQLRQVGLSLDSASSLTMNLVSPIIGMLLYHATGSNLQLTLIYIGSVFLLFAALFLVFFFMVPYREKHRNSFSIEEERENELRHRAQVEEGQPLMEKKNGFMQLQTRKTREVIYWCIHYKSLRNPIIIYAISLGITNADLLLTVLYLEMAWKDSGYGIPASTLSLIFAFSVIPACMMLVILPWICPRKITYATMMRVFMSIFSFAVLLTPTTRDLIPEANHENFKWIIYAIVFVKNCTSAKLFAPFIHFHLNSKCNRYIRTLINTINFVCSTLFTILLVNLLVPMLSILMFHPRFTAYAPWNKYPLFLILVILQFVALVLVEDEQGDQVLESVTEI